MAASKKSAKTSKTSHVLNVITGGPPADGAPTAEEGEQAALPVRDRHPIPPILELARENDDAISNQIMNALEEELKESEARETETPQSAAAPAPPLRPEEEPMEVPPLKAEEEDNPQPSAAAAETQAEAPPVTASFEEEKKSPNNFMQYINVMEKLVEEKASRYIKMMGVCSCSRCQADVKALCLTKLPAKYIVVHGDNLLMPMLTLYENKYASAITAQLIAACETVKKFPRH